MGESEELEQKILDYLRKNGQTKARTVPKAIGERKKEVDEAIGKLAREGKVEYRYLDTSYVKLAE